VGFNTIKSGEERGDGFAVGFLGCGEARTVDTVVNIGIDPFVGGLNFFLEVRGIQVDILELLGQDIVKL